MVLPDCNFIPEEDNAPPNGNEVYTSGNQTKAKYTQTKYG
jgi:hypothetical protein